MKILRRVPPRGRRLKLASNICKKKMIKRNSMKLKKMPRRNKKMKMRG
jgi:hypothetical protein